MTEVIPPAPPLALAVFGPRLELAERYVAILASEGIDHGLIGPRERDRLWDRHVLNCAVVSELLPENAAVIDVGSGAGLPGLALACARADLSVRLVEPLERRVRFLSKAVEMLNLNDQVEVVHARLGGQQTSNPIQLSQWITARAVAPIDRLVKWCLPLLHPTGTLLAMKGARARDELDEHDLALRQMGVGAPEIVYCGVAVLDEPVRVIVVRRD